MDSIALVDEMRGLASAAVHYTYTGTSREATTSREEARAFVADYETARGEMLTNVERRRLDAAAIYAMAYTARCEHSGDPSRNAFTRGCDQFCGTRRSSDTSTDSREGPARR
jgi:hypothetical protein